MSHFYVFFIFRYVMRHNELRLFETPNYEFLGHPINGFHFVRHVAAGWTDVRENVLPDDVITIKDDLGLIENGCGFSVQ
jgi:hypothetical protein